MNPYLDQPKRSLEEVQRARIEKFEAALREIRDLSVIRLHYDDGTTYLLASDIYDIAVELVGKPPSLERA